MAATGKAPGWREFGNAVGALADLLPLDADVEICAAPGPGGVALRGVPADLGPEAAGLLRDRIEPFLRALDDRAPLARDAAAGVWETLVLHVFGSSGHSFLLVRNLLGRAERAATFGTGAGSGARFAAWCRTRRQTCPADTSWDAGRLGRVVVGEDGEAELIDPGVVRLLGIAAAAGATTTHSCEGHPDGAYLSFRDEAGAFTAAMEALAPDWITERGPRGSVSEMRRVTGTADRDTVWRSTCASLEKALGLSGDLPFPAVPPGPGRGPC